MREINKQFIKHAMAGASFYGARVIIAWVFIDLMEFKAWVITSISSLMLLVLGFYVGKKYVFK